MQSGPGLLSFQGEFENSSKTIIGMPVWKARNTALPLDEGYWLSMATEILSGMCSHMGWITTEAGY